MKKAITLVLIFCFIFSSAISAFAVSNSETGENYGLIHDDVERLVVNEDNSGLQSYATSYDPRTTIMTDVKLQYDQTCWMYASMACVEQYNSLKNGTKNSYSEFHGIDVLSNELQSLNGLNLAKDNPGFYQSIHGTPGDFSYAIQYFTNWNEPIIGNNNVSWNSVIDNKLQGDINSSFNSSATSSIHVTGAKYIETSQSSIKSSILQYGAVYLPIYFDSTVFALNNYECYYDSTYTPANSSKYRLLNHAVCVVGWDDSYSKDNFFSNETLGFDKPSIDGAWLVRNSNYTQNGGYFWLSYYDQSYKVTRNYPSVITGVERINSNQKMLSYDFLPINESLSNYLEPVYMANIYDTSILSDDYNKITDVMTYFRTDGCYYDVYIIPADNINDLPLDFSRYSSLASGEFSGEGYTTIHLKNSYNIVQGEKYAVIIGMSPIITDNGIGIGAESNGLAGTYEISRNESLIFDPSKNVGWEDVCDYKLGNLCIRPIFEKSNQIVGNITLSPNTILNTNQDAKISSTENNLFSIRTSTYNLLRENIDYYRENNYIVLKQSYLKSLNGKYTELVFQFRDNIDKTIIINPKSNISRVSIQGKCAVNQELNAICVGQPEKESYDVNYQWQSSIDGVNWYNIASATSSKYKVTNNDFLRYIRVKITAKNNGNVIYPTTLYSSSTATKVIIYGDVNLDGVVDVNDAENIQLYSAGYATLNAEQRVAADVTGDGYIDIKDVSAIQYYAAGYISKFPVEE